MLRDYKNGHNRPVWLRLWRKMQQREALVYARVEHGDQTSSHSLTLSVKGSELPSAQLAVAELELVIASNVGCKLVSIFGVRIG